MFSRVLMLLRDERTFSRTALRLRDIGFLPLLAGFGTVVGSARFFACWQVVSAMFAIRHDLRGGAGDAKSSHLGPFACDTVVLLGCRIRALESWPYESGLERTSDPEARCMTSGPQAPWVSHLRGRLDADGPWYNMVDLYRRRYTEVAIGREQGR